MFIVYAGSCALLRLFRCICVTPGTVRDLDKTPLTTGYLKSKCEANHLLKC